MLCSIIFKPVSNAYNEHNDNDSVNQNPIKIFLKGQYFLMHPIGLEVYTDFKVFGQSGSTLAALTTSIFKVSRTVGDLVGLSPLLVDEDDGHEDDDLGHDAEEGPEGGEAAANAQVDLVGAGSDFAGAGADVVAHVVLDAQVVDGQHGLFGGALDLILVTGTVDDGLTANINRQLQGHGIRADRVLHTVWTPS